MKNQLIILSFLGIAALFQACVTIQVSPSGEVAKKQFASDDLYDAPQRVVASTKKVKSDYLNFDDNTVVIEEEEGIAEQSTYLNSRSVYNYNNSVNPKTYNQAYDSGDNAGFNTASSWNNWYVNPMIRYGYGFGTRWYSPLSSYNMMINPYYSPYGMMNDPFYFGTSYFGLGTAYGFNNYRFYNPFYNPWSSYNPYSNFGGVVYNNYNYYNSLGSNGYNYNNTTVDPPRKVNYGPRDAASSNRGRNGDSFSNTPRSGNNYYNNQGSNQPSTYSNRTAGTQSSERSAAPRRNNNVEYRYAEPSQSRQTETFSRPSYNSGGGSYGGGGSTGGGGGGGSSRGPR
ncbi:hypothetical protein V7S77_03245 [Aquirufa ecclesiirivi]